jgi:D-alanyl-D-alanine carboxypeptidase
MTRTAQSLGVRHTRFCNASGLPDERQYTTARDMALLGAALQARFPGKYRYFNTRAFSYRGHTYLNHSHLLNRIRRIHWM